MCVKRLRTSHAVWPVEKPGIEGERRVELHYTYCMLLLLLDQKDAFKWREGLTRRVPKQLQGGLYYYERGDFCFTFSLF